MKIAKIVTIGIFSLFIIFGINFFLGKNKQNILSKDYGNYISPAMVYIKPGSFMMGSAVENNNEKPVHKVTIKKGFYIGKYEVTFREFDKFCEDTGRKKPSDNGWGRGKRPVINVSWNDAEAYTKWLSQKTGKKYRLPTEAQWEYVARAGTTTKWSFGNDKRKLGDYAWYKDNSNYKTHQVGKKKPNPWGVYDTYGNVWEWCEDRYLYGYKNTPRDGSANRKGEQIDRVLRGGSWFNDPNYMYSAFRYGYVPKGAGSVFGFRVVQVF